MLVGAGVVFLGGRIGLGGRGCRRRVGRMFVRLAVGVEDYRLLWEHTLGARGAGVR